MKIINWKEFLYPYEQAVLELQVKFGGISNEYKRLNLYTPIESITGRVKKVSSILEKAARKKVNFDDIENKIEDIAGVRIVCKFVEDIAKVISLIHQRNGSDMTILQERDYIQNTKPSGYRSYHIIINYPLNTVKGVKHVKSEIQIRTLAMDFWATAEHSLKYKYSGNIPDALKNRLIICAEAAHHLDTEMSTIRNEITHAEKLNQTKNELVDEILEKIQNLHFVAKLDDMDSINRQFVNIWESDDVDKLKVFSEQLNIMADLYRV